MIKKALYTLEILIICAILFVAYHLFAVQSTPFIPFEHSLFELQNKYAERMQSNIEDFLQPVVGPGNIKASVQLKLSNTHQTIIQKGRSAQDKVVIKTTKQGVVLDHQNISVIINTTSSVSKEIFEQLLNNAFGIDTAKGDTLFVQLLPFKEIAPLTFGLSRLTLIRLAGVLLATIFVLFVVLFVLYFKENKTGDNTYLTGVSFPQQKLKPTGWEYFVQLTPHQINLLLSHISKGTLISALQTAPLQIHNFISKAVPAHIWNELLKLYQQTPYSFQQSVSAQEKMKQVYQELVDNKVL